MSDDKKRISKVRAILYVIFLIIIVASAVTGYNYYRTNRWIKIQDSPEEWVTIEGQIAEKNSAPCPQMSLKQGRAKFLPDTTGKGDNLLGYKLDVEAEMGKTEKDASKYTPYLYQTRFRFTLVDKDGFPLQTIEGSKDYEIFELSISRSYQNVCPDPIGDSIAERTNSIYVNYILSATGPNH
jgi:hypothetical protein